MPRSQLSNWKTKTLWHVFFVALFWGLSVAADSRLSAQERDQSPSQIGAAGQKSPPANEGKKGKKRKQSKPFAWVNPPSSKQQLPKGVSHRTFKSPSMGIQVGYYIYLPSAYKESASRKFPVVFHLHGGRPGSEAKSIKLAKPIHTTIEKKLIQPTIYVFPNGGPMSWYNYPKIEQGMGEDVFVKELIPHIQETFHTRELAIEGFSQGGRGTTRIMFRYPGLFSSAAPGGSGYEPEKRIQQNNGAESKTVVFAAGDNAWDLAEEYVEKYVQKENQSTLPIMLWVGTKGFNYKYNLKFSTFLRDLRIDHEMLVADGVAHTALGNYEKNGIKLMQFHQRFFKKP